MLQHHKITGMEQHCGNFVSVYVSFPHQLWAAFVIGPVGHRMAPHLLSPACSLIITINKAMSLVKFGEAPLQLHCVPQKEKFTSCPLTCDCEPTWK